ncbi:MAG: hypothetical protein ACN6O6_06495 [Pseudomonas sp.]|uniref:hypothetical protein n=1 Tax=Pseudomonas sp. TaxID=306 RepID=UPI003D0EF06C
MKQTRIRLFANNIHFSDATFDKYEPLVRQPSTHQGKVFLLTFSILFGFFIFGLTAERDWLAGVMSIAMVTVPFFVMYLMGRRTPPDHVEAFAESDDLLLKHECGRYPELSQEIRIPYSEINSIIVESMLVYEARHGPHRWRQYRISTTRPGENPNILINTFRPTELVLKDLKRLSALSALSHLTIRFLPSYEEHTKPLYKS